MAGITRTAQAEWQGTGREGKGALTTKSGVLSATPYGFNTRFGDQGTGALSYFFWVAKKFAITSEKGADTIVFLASAGEVSNVSGEYFYQRRPKSPSKDARDDVAAARLWRESEKLAGM